jgi:ankyrin repeat protein
LSLQGIDFEAKDDNGFTPLHLAVMSVESLKSTRPVRSLLIKGANRAAKDNKGRKPVQMIGAEVPN